MTKNILKTGMKNWEKFKKVVLLKSLKNEI
jgi:hypothetical protein